MYLYINNQTNVIETASTTLYDNDGTTHRIEEITNREYQEDMISSIFTDINNYVVFPGTINGTIPVSDGTQWIDPRTDNEVWVDVRAERDAELTKCDWTQLSDNALSAPDQALWVTWRDDLRNIPQDFPDANDAAAALNVLIANKP